MDHARLHERTRDKGVVPVVYWFVRVTFQPFFIAYFRMSRLGREHIPAKGPVIIASNHRSFLDPFVIACMVRRPMYYVAKQEIFAWRPLAWLLTALGAFPVDRGSGDTETIATAKAILARGDVVLIFPEGTRIRPGTLGRPHRGVGRLALETGAPVVPVAVIGTEAIRRGWRFRPHKVRLRAGRPLQFPRVPSASPSLAAAVTDRIWPCVMLQWEWLGGLPPVRRVAVLGAGPGAASIGARLGGAGYDVAIGFPTEEQPAKPELGDCDLILLAADARALPGVLAAVGERIPRRAGVLVLSPGSVPPRGTPASVFVASHCRARAVAVVGGVDGGPADLLEGGGSIVVACADRGFARQLRDVLGATGFDVSISRDVAAIELAAREAGAPVVQAA
jgi:glycerol-3-phosphate dehydrogenase (NAD(P)+)